MQGIKIKVVEYYTAHCRIMNKCFIAYVNLINRE